jgi:hypothetical protein
MLEVDDVGGRMLRKILFEYVPCARDDPFTSVDAGETPPKNAARQWKG